MQPGLAGGLLSSPQQQSAAYIFLTGTSVAFGVAALAAPQLLLTLALGVDATPLDVAFTRIAGATMAISAAVEYSLQVRLLCTLHFKLGLVTLCAPQPRSRA